MHASRLTACISALALGLGMPGLAASPGEQNDRPAATESQGRQDENGARIPNQGTPAGTGISSVQPSASPDSSTNFWPLFVHDNDAIGGVREWTSVGPLAFRDEAADHRVTEGLRPLWIQQRDSRGNFRDGYFLYPIFSYHLDENTYQWDFFELIRRTDRRGGAPAPRSTFEPRGDFELWPFIFWRRTGDPELSYGAIFPIGGTIKNKFGLDRASWVLFPLYTRTEKRGVVTTSVPWPIVRVTGGAAHGFGIWPLFDVSERPGMWKHQYYLWPLGYNNTTYPAPDAPAGTPPTRDIGALPFYARRTAVGYIDESYLWPFFGYTDRTQPGRYHEIRYLWPLLVQGRGQNHYVNRWGPIYTHSVVNGYDKTWYGWPLIRHAEWSDRGLQIKKTQLFYFLYWSETQQRSTRRGAPVAALTHVWPLYSAWDNGAGRQQLQFFSPLEVFFPGNEKIHDAWSPLFAVLRREQVAPGNTRTSLLWNAVTWRRNDAKREREFHFGPLFSVISDATEKRIAIGNGVIAFQRDVTGKWRTRWWNFGERTEREARAPHRSMAYVGHQFAMSGERMYSIRSSNTSTTLPNVRSTNLQPR